ncbi:hypothetical protein FB45DRAFT_907080 [Roridomyces roridus]|uniref:Uncharacterized protein n=1 Tax=Roridomyces roridus TaxID=1738132 RepID=A0AAD7C1U0_9AGAR|nr:hypothetical protein FB45DRAFT_907080 [Roridomyces roridus]
MVAVVVVVVKAAMRWSESAPEGWGVGALQSTGAFSRDFVAFGCLVPQLLGRYLYSGWSRAVTNDIFRVLRA